MYRIEVEETGQSIDIPRRLIPKILFELRELMRVERAVWASPDREAFEAVVAAVRSGITLDDICSQRGYPSRQAVYNWIEVYPEWGIELADAERELAGRLFKRVLEMIDIITERLKDDDLTPAQVSAYRVQLDNLRWACAKLDPNKFADYSKLAVDQKTSWRIIYEPVIVCSKCGAKLEGGTEEFRKPIDVTPIEVKSIPDVRKPRKHRASKVLAKIRRGHEAKKSQDETPH